MLNSVIMYLIQSEGEIPIQPLPNTAYYIIGKEVRIFNNAGQMATYVLPPQEKNNNNNNNLDGRLAACEKKISRIYNYLTSFRGEDMNE